MIDKSEIEKTVYYRYAEDVISGRQVAGEYVRLACERFMRDLENPIYRFNKKKVSNVFKIFSACRHFKGKAKGKSFTLEPWQKFVVANLWGFEREIVIDDRTGEKKWVRRFNDAYISLARKQGKALSLETPIPTPTGWTTMGEIKVGDFVLGRDGKPTKVTFVTPIMYNHDCYKVVFRDGEEIIADGDHNWYVRTGRKWEVKTTEELLRRGVSKIRSDGYTDYRFCVPKTVPLDLPEVDLPMEPYSLGVWLGDGDKNRPRISSWNIDTQIHDEISQFYGEPKIRPDKRTSAVTFSYAGDKAKNNSKFRHDLINAGVLHHKHIPSIYLRASLKQRLALLQGLMDTDGSCIKGQCEWVQKSSELADGFAELLATLGIQFHRMLKDVNGEKYHRFQFYLDKTFPCFRLKRKYEQLKDKLKKHHNKTIISIEKVESVPVRCITVDNEDHLYLCGERFTVTHNTALAAVLALVDLLTEPSAETIIAANSREQANIDLEFCKGFAASLDPTGRVLKSLRKQIEYRKAHSILKIISADAGLQDGLGPSLYIIDEFHEAVDNSLVEVLRSGTGFRTSPLGIIITTSGFNLDGPCKELEDTNIEILKGLKTDETNFIYIAQLDAEDDWKDEKNWLKCAPNLGVTVTRDFYRKRINDCIVHPELETKVLTKNFNKWVQSSEVWIPDEYIRDAMIANKARFDLDFGQFREQQCWIGIDLSSVSDLTSAAFTFFDAETEEFKSKIYYFLPRESVEKAGTNTEFYKNLERAGNLIVTEGNVVDYDYLLRLILQLQSEYQLAIMGLYMDKYNATQFSISATEQGLNVEFYSQTISAFNSPTKFTERLFLTRKIKVDANPLTLWCFQNVVLAKDHANNVKPTKGKSHTKKIDGVIALIMSIGGYFLTYGAEPQIFALSE